MDLLMAEKIFNKINMFVNLINNNIGILEADKKIEKDNFIKIVITANEDEPASMFLFNKFCDYAAKDQDGLFSMIYSGEKLNRVTVSYDLENPKNNIKVVQILINALYLAVDEVKIEFSFIIEKDEDANHKIPNDVIWTLDEWNYESEISEDEPQYLDYDQIVSYKLHKNALYGISLGYYDIDMDLVESDIIPELIGIVLHITNDFCYATSYEDDYIRIYTVKELTEDDIFDIEEGLFDLLHIISKKEQNETLEEVWANFKKGENTIMDKEYLKEQFLIAKEKGKDIAIELTVPTKEVSEIIIVKNDNLDYKLDYYLNNYNDKLELERFTEIKILSITLIEWDIDELM